jgi:PhzF family phenazine biosynthesis protein
LELPIYQVDAFSQSAFAGNPAAVCPLSEWLPDETLQAIAAENNLSETAFFVTDNGSRRLRWFTPGCEVDLCGHATLATAHILFEELKVAEDRVAFQTKSGELTVQKRGDKLVLDFPARDPGPIEADPRLVTALGGPKPVEILAARDYLIRYENAEQVLGLTPDMEALKQVDRFGFIVTAPGTDCDFVSRFFAPAKGVPEDPVTGSAHCSLVPYWARVLGKTTLHAKQVSRRGGELFCRLTEHNRVEIGGYATLFLKGTIQI